MQPDQLEQLTLLRYEFVMDEFLEMMYLLPSLQVLDIEIISLLSLTSSLHPQCSGLSKTACPQHGIGRDENIFSRPMQNGEWRSSPRESSQDDGCMLVDQDEDQTQWDIGSQQHSQSDGFQDQDDISSLHSCGHCIKHLQSQHQFSSVRSLTFRGVMVISELPGFFPSLESLALEESHCPPVAPPSYPNYPSRTFYNSPAKNSYKRSRGSGYNSRLPTDSDTDSLDPLASMNISESAHDQNRLAVMISELALTLLDNCPRLSRLVLNEPLLIDDDHQNPGMQQQEQPQQLTLLLRAIPQLRQFVAHVQVVARCPGLIETLIEYHHPHLTLFQVHEDSQVDKAAYAQYRQTPSSIPNLTLHAYLLLISSSNNNNSSSFTNGSSNLTHLTYRSKSSKT
ncbi:hypothetical protein BGZ65_009971 [Modicella reniformis]|uniref:Uncharacterized protein n=1 Tax=Modicella reniformis TaxID=1440133 RepID=A0A9P6M162_9FUNG|nr:hypothetical protein BGZ65_009971 [Modicella reniformis]